MEALRDGEGLGGPRSEPAEGLAWQEDEAADRKSGKESEFHPVPFSEAVRLGREEDEVGVGITDLLRCNFEVASGSRVEEVL